MGNLVKNIYKWIQTLSNDDNIFFGYHPQFLSSLVYSLSQSNFSEKELFAEAKYRLLWLIKPEILVSMFTNQTNLIGTTLKEIQEDHCPCSLVDFLDNFADNFQSSKLKLQNQHRFVIFTYSEYCPYLQKIHLDAFPTQDLILNELEKFWNDLTRKNLFLEYSNQDSLSSSFNAFLSYIIKLVDQSEKEFQLKNLNTGGKNIYLIVSMNTHKKREQLRFDFEKKWNYLFIDSLGEIQSSSFSMKFNLKSFLQLSQSWEEILNQIQIPTLIQNNIASCLSYLDFKLAPNLIKIDVFAQLGNNLERLLKNSNFMLFIEQLIKKEILKEKTFKLDTKKFRSGGSFQTELFSQIQNKIIQSFSWIVSKLNRNMSLNLSTHPLFFKTLENCSSTLLAQDQDKNLSKFICFIDYQFT